MKTWTIHKLPKTANERLRMNKWKRTDENRLWRDLVLVHCGKPRFGEVQGKSKVRITMYRKRLQDPDNAVASVKPVLDALKRKAWLVDDSPEYLELEVREVKAKEQKTVIEWERAQ